MNRPAVAALDDRDDPDPAVDLDDLADLLGRVLAAEGAPDGAEASLTLVDPAAIAALKAAHLGVEEPTDVLAFPIDGLGGGDDTARPDGTAGPLLVGDVVVCPRVADDQAPAHAGNLADELALLVVHGGLHLCGWDHDGDDARAAMWARERELLGRWQRLPARDPWSAP